MKSNVSFVFVLGETDSDEVLLSCCDEFIIAGHLVLKGLCHGGDELCSWFCTSPGCS